MNNYLEVKLGGNGDGKVLIHRDRAPTRRHALPGYPGARSTEEDGHI